MIKLLVMDVDGTLTDGKIYMGQEAELTKAFDVKDGAGIVLLLPKLGIIPVVITARESKILENRCRELNITELYQNSKDKLSTLSEILKKYDVDLSSVAYAGDDLPDIPCMEEIRKAGGAILAPADAIPEIRSMAEYVSAFKAGEGAIRDCINYLAQRNKDDVEERVRRAIDWILAGEYSDGVLPDGSPYTIQEYTTKPEEECVLESHRRHIDVQYMIEGHEEFRIYTTNCLTSAGTYNEEKDAEFWKGGVVASHSLLIPGSLIVVYNGQPHKGAIMNNKAEKVKKLVCKIET
ncbi:MAG: YhcH/YjgK/YiaL family protein [Lachnospiraceae bacterium]|nr:YhcH/YjgK/YiaL family protein [Lachnospiraceae bacterium]